MRGVRRRSHHGRARHSGVYTSVSQRRKHLLNLSRNSIKNLRGREKTRNFAKFAGDAPTTQPLQPPMRCRCAVALRWLSPHSHALRDSPTPESRQRHPLPDPHSTLEWSNGREGTHPVRDALSLSAGPVSHPRPAIRPSAHLCRPRLSVSHWDRPDCVLAGGLGEMCENPRVCVKISVRNLFEICGRSPKSARRNLRASRTKSWARPSDGIVRSIDDLSGKRATYTTGWRSALSL